MHKMLRHFAMLITGLCPIAHPTSADEPILSPEAVINAIEGSKDDLTSKGKEDLDFAKLDNPSLSDKEAGQVWADLLITWLDNKGNEIVLTQLFESIPSLASWPTIAEAIREKADSKNYGQKLAPMMFLFAFMTEDNELAEHAYKSVSNSDESTSRSARRNPYDYNWEQNHLLSAYQEFILASKLDKSFRRSVFLDKLKQAKNPNSYIGVNLSTVAELFSGDEARQVLTQILEAKELDVNAWYLNDSAIMKTAIEIALQNPGKLKQKPWYLIRYTLPESMELFDKLAANYQKNDDDWSYAAAAEQRLLGYLMKRQSEEALKILKTQSDDVQFDILSTSVYEISETPALADPLFEFYNDYIYPWEPSLISWPDFLALATIAEQLPAFEEKIDKQLNVLGLDPLLKNELLTLKAHSLLSQNKVDAGMKLIHEQLKGQNFDGAYELFNTALDYANIGYLEKNSSWQREGYAFAQKAIEDSPDEEKSELYASVASQLLYEGSLAEAQKAIIAGLKTSTVNPEPGDTSGMIDDYSIMNDPAMMRYYQAMMQSMHAGDPKELTAMNLAIYSEQGDYKAVLDWLNNAPWWGVSDLIDVHSYMIDEPVQIISARALWKDGNITLARKIVHEYLEFQNSGNDSAYHLLVEIDGSAALPFLRRLAKANRFEERPLIWEATVLLDEGNTDQAEKLIMKAIEIDPSDGEQGKGDRMRAYSVLSEIKEAQGKTDETDFFEKVMKAIRLAENADDFYAAGLTKKAIDMYHESLSFFQDAYCIQSRMAIQLAEQGNLKEAAVHYKKAFELMPSSFGRVESHCFGCEGAFQGPMAQSIAEQVFSDMLKDDPKNPRLQYLMGYLKDSQGNSEAALSHYWEAVKLDPDYLNAWKKLLQYNTLSKEQGTKTVEALIRLDPRSASRTATSIPIGYFAANWEALNTALATQTNPPTSLLKLEASDKYLKQIQIPGMSPTITVTYDYNKSQAKTAAQAMSMNYNVQRLIELFKQSALMRN